MRPLKLPAFFKKNTQTFHVYLRNTASTANIISYFFSQKKYHSKPLNNKIISHLITKLLTLTSVNPTGEQPTIPDKVFGTN